MSGNKLRFIKSLNPDDTIHFTFKIIFHGFSGSCILIQHSWNILDKWKVDISEAFQKQMIIYLLQNLFICLCKGNVVSAKYPAVGILKEEI